MSIAILKPRDRELRVPGRSHHSRLNVRHPIRTLIGITESAMAADKQIAKNNVDQARHAQVMLKTIVHDLRYIASRLEWTLADGYRPMAD